MAFGITSTANIQGYWSLNSRRKVFYQYPTGAAPLMGLLSLLPSEDTDKDQFGWWEQRFPVQRTQTAASGTAPFLTAAGGTFADGSNFVADTEYRVNVLSTAEFKPTHQILISNVALSNAGSYVDVQGIVTQVNSATQLTFRPLAAATSVDNATTDNNSKYVKIIGTANQQGARSGVGILTYPVNPTNYTQIFRTAFSVTRTALKAGLVYDRSGVYKTKVKDNGLRHMIEMEKAHLWGQRSTRLVADPETGEQTPENTMGGVQWFLQQWEAANSVYRGGSGAPAVTLNTDPDKRIIDLRGSAGTGTLSTSAYNGYIARLFKKTSDSAYEKLCLCGGTFLETINSLFEKNITRSAAVSDKNRNWEFQVHSHTTLRGTVHYAVHPLFDEDPEWAASAMFLDLGLLRERPLSGSDTTFLKGRQENDRDARKDEWISELGLELQFPEAHMIIHGANAAA
jgi:hypothetical protein